MTTEGPGVGDYMPDRTGISYLLQRRIETSLNIDSLIVSKLPKVESTCLTTISGLEI